MSRVLSALALACVLGGACTPSAVKPPAPAASGRATGVAPAPAALPPARHAATATATIPASAAEAFARQFSVGPRANPRSPLGNNLTSNVPWSGEWPWKDAYKQAVQWRSQNTNYQWDERKLDLDADGWIRSLAPDQWAVSYVFVADPSLGLRYPKGRYTITWQGRGELQFEGGKVLSQTDREAVVDADGQYPLGLRLLRTDAHLPLRKIRVIMPGGACKSDDTRFCDGANPCDASDTCVPFAASVDANPFHPQFLRNYLPYSTLRFLTWNATIGSQASKWAERPRVDTASWCDAVPYEIMARLSNRLHTDMWVTIPVRADDEYVRELAKLLYAQLDPELKLYVEYTNEPWNDAFPEAPYLRGKGLEAKLSPDPFTAQLSYYSVRAGQVMAIFSEVFGEQAPARLVRVLAGQGVNTYVAEVMLGADQDRGSFDAFAIAPYFGNGLGTPEARDLMHRSTPAQVVDMLQKTWMPDALSGVRKHGDLLRAYQAKTGRTLKLVAYEGGQHLTAIGPVFEDMQVQNLFREALKQPEMKRVYLDYLAGWRANGGELFVHYQHLRLPSKWGDFGLIDRPDRTRRDSPRLDAVLTFIEQNPRWW